jgi:hypothetical protein
MVQSATGSVLTKSEWYKLSFSLCLVVKLVVVPEVGRWSAETGSDNEFCHKTNSPNPLPNPDVTPETCLPALQSEQYMVRTHYDNHYNPNSQGFKSDYLSKMMHHENMNFQDYAERGSDVDDKHHMNDKYLFPYTGKNRQNLNSIALNSNNYMQDDTEKGLYDDGY